MAKTHTRKEESHGQQKLVLVARLDAEFVVENMFTSYIKPEFSKTWTKADRKEMRWRDAAISFHEAGLQMKDTRVS